MRIKEMKVPVEEQEQRFNEEDDDDDDDEGSYIEISLEAKPMWDKNMFQFRLSFSTILPRNSDSGGSFRRTFLMSAESVESRNSESYIFSSDASSISSCSSSSSAVLGRSYGRRNPSGMVFVNPAQGNSLETSFLEKENKWKKAVQFLAAQRLVKLLMLNLRSSTETNTDAQKRKRSKAREVIKSGLMKLIIKFRTIQEKSINTLTRASNHISGSRYVTQKTHKLSHKCYDSSVIEPVSATEERRSNKSKLPAVSVNSIKSSLVHRNYCTTESRTIKTYSRENSIQAAIAHCKMSLYQTAPVTDK